MVAVIYFIFIFKRDGELIRNPYRWLAKAQDTKDKKRKDRKSDRQVRNSILQNYFSKILCFSFNYIYHQILHISDFEITCFLDNNWHCFNIIMATHYISI